LRKAPGFTLTAVLTLALGIGATTAIFTLVEQVMLQSLPVTRPDELWRIGDQTHCCQWAGYSQDGDGEPSERRLRTRPGDYVYVPPWVPHREENPEADEEAIVVIARTTQEAIVVNLKDLSWTGPVAARRLEPGHRGGWRRY